MKKAVWISYDLGIQGDYEGLYSWFADHNATECGDRLGFVQYEPNTNLIEELKRDLSENVKLNGKARIYVIYRSEDNKIKGNFLFGKRKQAPWTGYGSTGEDSVDELQ